MFWQVTMKKIKIGIVGFGNLGKAVLEVFSRCPKIKIVAIFSEHLEVKQASGVPVFKPSLAIKFKNKIDLIVLCHGSQSQILKSAPFFAKHFNTINTFDTHKKIKQQFALLNNIGKQNKTFNLIACGWDPGVFSIFRAYFSLFCEYFAVFYGKGISLGHTNAVKRIKGVCDAISFTMPNSSAYKLAKSGIAPQTNLLRREVFVVPLGNTDIIKQKILNMPNYFKGENTIIHFVSIEKLNQIKTLAHKGEIIAYSKNLSTEKYNFKFETTSNPLATAKILLAYSLRVCALKQKFGAGAFTPLHFSLLDLCGKNIFKEV